MRTYCTFHALVVRARPRPVFPDVLRPDSNEITCVWEIYSTGKITTHAKLSSLPFSNLVTRVLVKSHLGLGLNLTQVTWLKYLQQWTSDHL
jgi:hypothetical protein